ncbi:unnamed protein product [Schistocephalus solidus]|uniref:Nucleolar protein 16 n=1 Tax=Schistocephalus solidus TaxID=70667 RepID=A0A183THB0_SCHSO|nr:unnamed protein product [Schistocephalus solidus]
MRSVSVSYFNLVNSLRNERNSVVVIYFDLSKAFDQVPHKHLLEQLEALSFRPTLFDFIGSYLSNCSQKVLDTFHEFRVPTMWKLCSVLVAFTDSESCAAFHAEGNIAGSADLNRLIPQSSVNSRSLSYLLVQNTGSITLKGEEFKRELRYLSCPSYCLLLVLPFFPMGKNTFDYTKDRRKLRRKEKKPIVIKNPILQKSWMHNMSVKANFQKLGLAFNPNQAVEDLGSEGKSKFSTETSTVKGFVELKKVKSCSKQREKFISEDDRLFSMYMMELYGDDHKAMSRDPKNVYQLTPTQIRRLIERFRASSYFEDYLVQKNNNSLRVLELYDA